MLNRHLTTAAVLCQCDGRNADNLLMAHPVQTKTKVASLKLTPEQHKMIDLRAKQCGVRMSVWMRSILLQAASRHAQEGYLRIREPDGATT